MEYDLDNLSRKELEQLRTDVETALATLEDRERKAAIEAAEEAARAHGYRLEQLAAFAAARPRGKNKSKNPAKYRNPENPDQTWTGRGRKPQWIKEAEESGKDLASYEI